MRVTSHARILCAPNLLLIRSYAPASPIHAIIASPTSLSSRPRQHGRRLHLSASPRRLAAVPQPQPQPQQQQQEPLEPAVCNETPQLQTQTTPLLSPSAANPPASTRPPPLELPVRKPDATKFSHFLATAKAYLAFYKTGLRQIYTNTRLVWSKQPLKTTTTTLRRSGPAATPLTRSTLHLHLRWRHDARRVPLFALMLLICGEFTPLVVLAVPRVAPLTCRIPAQVARIRRDAEARRRKSAETLRARMASASAKGPAAELPYGVVAAHLARSLGVVSTVWDGLGFVPAALAGKAVASRLRLLALDDALLAGAGGVDALEGEEVVLACVDRGIDVLGREEGELRSVLGRWMDLAGSHNGGPEESTRRMAVLLMQGEGEWPRVWPEEAA